MTKIGWIWSWFETQPPLMQTITAAPLALGLGREHVHRQRRAELAAVNHVLRAGERRFGRQRRRGDHENEQAGRPNTGKFQHGIRFLSE